MTYIDDNRELPAGLWQPRENTRNWSSDQFFVFLGQFTSDNDVTIANQRRNVAESR